MASVLELAPDGEYKRIFRAVLDEGWDIRLGRNHFKFFNKDGHFVTATGSTPSDYRASRNLIAELRQGGINVKPPHSGVPKKKRGPKRGPMRALSPPEEPVLCKTPPVTEAPEGQEPSHAAEAPAEAPSTSSTSSRAPMDRDSAELVRLLLQEHPGRLFTPDQVARQTGVEKKKVYNTLTQAVRNKPGFTRSGRGQYIYHPVAAEVRVRQVEPAPPPPPPPPRPAPEPRPLRVRTTAERRADAAAEALAQRTKAAAKVPDRAANGSKPDNPPTSFTTLTVDRRGRLVLMDDQGNVWMAAPIKVDLDQLLDDD